MVNSWSDTTYLYQVAVYLLKNYTKWGFYKGGIT